MFTSLYDKCWGGGFVFDGVVLNHIILIGTFNHLSTSFAYVEEQKH